jgi:hypothetical protein
MARNRVIYQNEGLFVGGTGDGAQCSQIKRVQSANYSFDISRQDVNQYGQLARIDSIILTPPTVSLDFNYYVTDATNEELIGLSVGGGINAVANLITGEGQEQNYFIATTEAGNDLLGYTDTTGFIGIGNGFLSSYSVDAAVGDLPTASVTIEAANMAMSTNGVPLVTINKTNGALYDLNTGNVIPAPTSGAGATALRPGDITVWVTGGIGIGLDANNFKPTSASVSFDLNREDIEKLGSKFAFAKEIDFPVTVTFTTEGLIGELEAQGLHQIVESDTSTYSGYMELAGPSGQSGIRFDLKGLKLDSQSVSSSIGDNKTVSLSFSTQLGGPQDTTNGLFISRVAP